MKKQRRILFLTSVGVFLISSFLIVAYAIGYRLDFLENRLVKTGSLHIKVQTNSVVFINDRNVGETSFIGNSFSKNNLLPREYKIRIEKEGYYSWQKTVSIQGGLLSDFSSVFLVKKEPLIEMGKETETEISSKSFEGTSVADPSDVAKIADVISLSPAKIKKAVKESGYFYVIADSNKKKSLYRVKDDFKESELLTSSVEGFVFDYSKSKIAWFSKNELWVSWLRDTSYQPIRKSGEKELIVRTSKNIKNAQWHQTEEHIIFILEDEINFVELDGRNERNFLRVFQGTSLKDIYYDKNKERLYVTTKNNKGNFWISF